MRLRTWLVLLGLLLSAGRLHAQELQVPLDAAGRLDVVDLRLAQRLGLFVGRYPGFQEARLFQLADSSFVLEVTTLERGRTMRQRVPLSAEEVETLRRDLTARLGTYIPRRALNQEGRSLLLGQTTLLGLGLYGPALPYALNADGTGAGGLYLLTAAASFFGPFAATEGRDVSYGMANLSRYGATRGASHGVMLHQLVAGDEESEEREFCPPGGCYVYEYDDSDAYERGMAGLAVGLSVAEGVAGYLWARNERMSAGTANTIVLGGDLGGLWGLGTAVLIRDGTPPNRLLGGLGLAGSALGIGAGRALAARRNHTWGDADVIYTAAAAGAFAGLALSAAADAPERAAVATTMLGSAAGVVLGDRAVRETDFSVAQATLNRLGTLAGGLAGASLGVMAENGDVALIGAAAGALLGYGVTYAVLARDAREQRGERISSVRLQLSPEALLAARAQRRGVTSAPLPVVQVQVKF